MKTQAHRPRQVWGDTSARALAVCTSSTLDDFTCPLCRGACLKRPKRWTACPSDFDWVCHKCSAHGWAHSRAAEAAAAAPEVSDVRPTA